MRPQIHDSRTAPRVPWGFVAATDSFLSGWGYAAHCRSIYVLAVTSFDEAELVAANARHRSDMLRVRIVGRNYLSTVRLHTGEGLGLPMDRGQEPARSPGRQALEVQALGDRRVGPRRRGRAG